MHDLPSLVQTDSLPLIYGKLVLRGLELNGWSQSVCSKVSHRLEQLSVLRIVRDARAQPSKKRTYLIGIPILLVSHEILFLQGNPSAECEASGIIVNRYLDDASNEIVVAVNDARVGRELDPFASLSLRNTPAMIRTIASDIRKFIMNFAALGTPV